MENYGVIGIMSGTSLDGLDVAFCEIIKDGNQWSGKILQADTYVYNQELQQKLINSYDSSAIDFIQLHNSFGKFIGEQVNHFIKKYSISPDFIASHGHTVFHIPRKGISFQLGNGAYIAAETEVTTISDFRTFDVALGGQGAPLVPIGDKLIFSEYDTCLNLGGIGNMSYEKNGKRLAFDICPVNMVLNKICTAHFNIPFDENGKIARSGKIDTKLLKDLDSLLFYFENPPKTLGIEWVKKVFHPHLNRSDASPTDILRTLTEHIAHQISNAINHTGAENTLVTGGGAFNKFLIERLTAQTNSHIVVPDDKLVKYKEALLFAFLGVLRMRNEHNCLSSVTGAKTDNIGGIIHLI